MSPVGGLFVPFKKKLKELRQKAGYTQEQLAGKAGMPLGNVRNCNSHHGFRGYPGRRNHADIAALVTGAGGLAGIETDGFQRPAQGGNGLEIAADQDVLAIGNPSFDSPGVVRLAGKSGKLRRVLFP